MSPLQLVLASVIVVHCAACGPSDVPPPKEPEAAPAAAEPEQPAPKVQKATLAIDSGPQGMQVLIDGKPVGKTPVTVDVASGTHKVTIKDAANGDATEQLDVGEGEYKTWKYNVPPRADRPAPANARE